MDGVAMKMEYPGETITRLKNRVLNLIREEAVKSNGKDGIGILLEQLEVLDLLSDTANRLKESLEWFRLGAATGGSGAAHSGNGEPSQRLRAIQVKVTEGMLNNSMLLLTHARTRGIIATGEEFEILMPDGDSFKTDLAEPGNRLRERGRFKRYYREHGIEAGDVLLLLEHRPGVWKLVRGPSGTPVSSLESEQLKWDKEVMLRLFEKDVTFITPDTQGETG